MSETWAYKLIWADEKKQGPNGVLYKMVARRLPKPKSFEEQCQIFSELLDSGHAIGDEKLLNDIISHYGLSAVHGYCGDGFVEFKNYSM